LNSINTGQLPIELSKSEWAMAEQFALLWGTTREQAAARMISEQMRAQYVLPRGPSAQVIPLQRRKPSKPP
jgi:hypothetical protein